MKLKLLSLFYILFLTLLFLSSCKQTNQISDISTISLTATSNITFLEKNQSTTFLQEKDNFINSLSSFDKISRAKSKDISTNLFLDYISSQALDWKPDEKNRINKTVTSIIKDLEGYSLTFPEKIFLIKTTGDEEGHALYTRRNAIILPLNFLENSKDEEEILKNCLIHEIFHIYSKFNPSKREALYNILGFYKSVECSYPPELQEYKITNPDGYWNNHYIKIRNKSIDVVPILYFTKDYNFDEKNYFLENIIKNITNYLTLLAVDIKDDVCSPIYKNGSPYLINISNAPSYIEQVGENTKYIFHPDEILAENFVLLIKNKNVQTPHIITKMSEVLKNNS